MGHDLGRYHCYLSLMEYGNLDLFHGIDTPGMYKNQKSLFIKEGNKLVPNKKEIEQMYKELEEMTWIDL